MMFHIRRYYLLTLVMLLLGLVLTACGGGSTSSSGPITIKFYGDIPAWPSNDGMKKAVQDHFKGKYNVQFINVDWNNLDTVIQTGIVSGKPADIYFYWPAALTNIVKSQQALDLTPYLEADNSTWKKTFVPAHLELGNFNGKYYGVPSDVASSTIFVNEDLAQKLGVTIPDRMSWDQFMSINQQIKEKGGNSVYPFGIFSQWLSWLPRNALLSLANDEHKVDAYGRGQIPATDPIYTKALENTGALFKNNDVFPGGSAALSQTQDQMLAAFQQGKVVMMASVFSGTQTVEEAAKNGHFKIKAVGWPNMGTSALQLGGCDGFFIPANAPHPKEAAEVLQYYLGKDVQSIDAKYGLVPSNVQAQAEISDPVLKSVVQTAAPFAPKEVISLSPKLSQYFDKNLLQDYVLGQSASTVLGKLDQLIQEAKQSD